MSSVDTETVHYYYLRARNEKDKTVKSGVPYGVVAVRANEDGTVNRGISICSTRDIFKKKTGRGIALSRLLNAEKNKKDGERFKTFYGRKQYSPIQFSLPFEGEDLFEVFRLCPSFSLKEYFHSEMFPFEHRMFYKPMEVEDEVKNEE